MTDLFEIGKRSTTLQFLLGIKVFPDNSEKRDPYLSRWIFVCGLLAFPFWPELSSLMVRVINTVINSFLK